VMHEFKHGELKSGPGGKGGKVKSRKQAIAIALHEAGESKYDSKAENKKHLAHTKAKERQGKTAGEAADPDKAIGAVLDKLQAADKAAADAPENDKTLSPFFCSPVDK